MAKASSSLGALARFGRGKKAAEKAAEKEQARAVDAAAAKLEAARKREDDRFIDEVSEELQRERLIAMAWRYGPIALGALVAIVIAVAALEFQSAARTDAARSYGGALAEAAALEDPAERAARFETLAGDASDASGRAVARLYAADAALAADDPDRAVALYAGVAEDAELAPLYRDLAALKSVQIRLGELDASEVEAQLEPLTGFGAPYRALALEQIGLAQARGGRIEAARATLAEAAADERATALLQQRVQLTLETFPAPAPASDLGDDAAAPSDAETDAPAEN